jgi:LysM repeat protein
MKSFEFLLEADTPSVPKFTPGGDTKRVSGNMPNIRPLPDSSNIYTVNSGDSLESLCKRFDTTPDGIAWLNPGLDIKTIKPGTKIRVRGDEKRAPTVDGPTSGGGASGNAKTALDYFIQQGWTPEQAAGLVANLQAESGTKLDPNIFGDGGAGYGIAQWHGSRQRDFQREMGRPLKGSSLEDQLKFVQWELEHTEKRAGQRLKNAKSAAEAAAIVDQYYERSSGIHRDKRIKLAQNLVPSQLAEPRP